MESVTNTSDSIRLNIGAGESQLPGFLSIDIKDGKPAFPLDYPDGSVAEVYASHVLEHLSRADAQAAVAEWKRVLAPGGRLRIAVPDDDKCEQQKKLRNAHWEAYRFGGQTDEHDFHRSAYTEGKLRTMLESTGWEKIGGWEPEFNDTAAHPISLRMEAYKHDPAYIPLRLNIGGGERNPPGFTNFDIADGNDATKRMPFDDNSVDEIYTSHTLEHIHHSLHPQVLKEWVRVLKPGGTISIAVPDIDAWIAEYAQGKVGMATLRAFMHGDSLSPENHHVTLFNAETLRAAMRQVGIGNVREFEPIFNDYSAMPNSLNLRGEKHNPIIKPNPKVMIVMSLPRLGFTDCLTACMTTCRQTGWDHLDWGTSGDWHSSLTFGIEEAIRQGADYAFVIDYDSVFTAEDAHEMLRLMQAHPEAAAIYPVQVHRHVDSILGFDKKYDYTTGEVTDVDTGHFACTMIRLSCMKEVPHPWFMAFPDPVTGKWKQGHKLDADISFWLHLKLAGFTVYQANNVQVGHIEPYVKWTRPNGVIAQPLAHYKQFGKPTDAAFDGAYWKANPAPAATRDGFRPDGKHADGSYKNGTPRVIPEAQALAESNGHAPEPGSGLRPEYEPEEGGVVTVS